LAVVLFLHHLPFPWQVKKWNLWIASYIFYAAWNPPFVVLLWISTVVDWFAGSWIYRTQKPSFKRALLFLSLGANLGLLGYFKYGEFLLENFIGFLSVFHIDFQPAAPDVVLPVGISFYTFQSISYSFDIYREKIRPWKRFSDFALFVTFFPQLVAGPIVRAADFLPQTVDWGLSLIAIGLFEKIILADDILAPVADNVFAQPLSAGQMDTWIGTLAFSGQIFFDFSGYSICAIGTAMCLGFVLPDNFHFPYAAVGFSDFWRRWHRSLSTWLRDYLYISLGGNRKGSARTHLNLMLTMLIGGAGFLEPQNFLKKASFV
jgi:alginate O-acetyltransferase complex protein AlgI